MGLALVGCYTLRPTGGAIPSAGTEVAFDVNDAGRVALGGAMGPEIAQVQGRLLSKDNGDYVVAVSSVRYLRGGEQTWSGEPVHIKSEYVGTTYERRFSKGRTIALSAVAIGGFTAFIVTRKLIGSGEEPPITPIDTGHTYRGPRP